PPPIADQALRNFCPGPVEAKKRATGNVEKELCAVRQIRCTKAIEHLFGQSAWIRRRLEHEWRYCAHEHGLRDALRAVTPDEPRDFATTSRVANQHRILQVECLEQFQKIVRIRVHVVAIPWLTGAAMHATVVPNAAVPVGRQEKHLRFPGIRSQRPSVAEYDRLAGAPVFEINLCPVLRSDYVVLLRYPHSFPFGLEFSLPSRHRLTRSRSGRR